MVAFVQSRCSLLSRLLKGSPHKFVEGLRTPSLLGIHEKQAVSVIVASPFLSTCLLTLHRIILAAHDFILHLDA